MNVNVPTLSQRTRQGWGTLTRQGKNRGNTVVILRETGLRELQLQFGEDLNRSFDLIRPLSDALCHFQQNAMDFCQFFVQQSQQLVILLNGFKRLYKNRLTAGTGSV